MAGQKHKLEVVLYLPNYNALKKEKGDYKYQKKYWKGIPSSKI